MIRFTGYPDWAEAREDDAGAWLQTVAVGHRAVIKNLAYTFVNDEEIMEINRDFLQHDYATDIITFGYEEGDRVEGEVFISLETLQQNSIRFGVSQDKELLRLLAHGLLHLIGFDDKTEAQKSEMRKQEEKCLLLHPKILKKK